MQVSELMRVFVVSKISEIVSLSMLHMVSCNLMCAVNVRCRYRIHTVHYESRMSEYAYGKNRSNFSNCDDFENCIRHGDGGFCGMRVIGVSVIAAMPPSGKIGTHVIFVMSVLYANHSPRRMSKKRQVLQVFFFWIALYPSFKVPHIHVLNTFHLIKCFHACWVLMVRLIVAMHRPPQIDQTYIPLAITHHISLVNVHVHLADLRTTHPKNDFT